MRGPRKSEANEDPPMSSTFIIFFSETLAACRYDLDCMENAYCWNQEACYCKDGYVVYRNRSDFHCLKGINAPRSHVKGINIFHCFKVKLLRKRKRENGDVLCQDDFFRSSRKLRRTIRDSCSRTRPNRPRNLLINRPLLGRVGRIGVGDLRRYDASLLRSTDPRALPYSYPGPFSRSLSPVSLGAYRLVRRARRSSKTQRERKKERDGE